MDFRSGLSLVSALEQRSTDMWQLALPSNTSASWIAIVTVSQLHGGLLCGELFQGIHQGACGIQGEVLTMEQFLVPVQCFILKLPFDDTVHLWTTGFIALGSSRGLGRQKADRRNSFVGEDITKIRDFFSLGSSSPPLSTSKSVCSCGLLELLRPAVLATSRFSTLLVAVGEGQTFSWPGPLPRYLLFKCVMKSLQCHPYYTITVKLAL